ncbi:MAG: ribonuclease HI [Bacteroidales bacterium]|nr:ribonuclease HI [Bacteroidales bacterium]
MEIINEKNGIYTISIFHDNSSCRICFSPETKELQYSENNDLTQFLKLKEFQLRKLLHNKRPNSFFIGFKLNFVLHDGLPDTSYYDLTKITVLDNLNNEFNVSKTRKKTPKIPELFTDGSFNHVKNTGGFAILIKTIQNEYLMNQVKTKRKGNNLIELLAVIEGLKYLKKEKKIRIVTDSQYVIKGITEWLPLWKLNEFYTANGSKAKNITEWKKIDALIKNKYLEFEWVKAHSDHFENTICDMKAKSISK